MTLHLHAIWLANNSRRSKRLERKTLEAEEQLKLTKRLIEELSEDKQSKYWWVN